MRCDEAAKEIGRRTPAKSLPHRLALHQDPWDALDLNVVAKLVFVIEERASGAIAEKDDLYRPTGECNKTSRSGCRVSEVLAHSALQKGEL